jgi:gliding motility-associated-like protein
MNKILQALTLSLIQRLGLAVVFFLLSTGADAALSRGTLNPFIHFDVTTINSITRVGASPVKAASVQYTVTFGADVTGVSTSNFALSPNTVSGAAINSVSGSGDTYTVTVTTGTGSGNFALQLANATGLSSDISDPLPFTGDTYSIDRSMPTVQLISVPANGTYGIGSALVIGVDFGEPLTLTGTPYIDVSLNTGGIVHATYSSVSGNKLLFSYTVVSGNVDNNGIDLGTRIALNGGSLEDAAGNPADLTLSGTPSTAAVLVDGVRPTVSSITIAGESSTNATSVDYNLTFSKNVTGVDIADFTLTSTGTVTGTVSSVSGTGNAYVVTVNSVTGDGTLRLDLIASGAGIKDAALNAVIANFTSGQTYTLLHIPPPLISYSSPQLYAPGIAIAPLSPGSTNVGAAGYNTKVAIAGSVATATTPAIFAPTGIVVAGGIVYAVNNNGGSGKLQAIPTGLSYSTGFNTPVNMATDVAGNIYVADLGLSVIKKITPAGVASTVGSGLSLPFGVAVDAAGNVYVCEIGNSDVVKIAATNGVKTVLAKNFTSVYDVDVDAIGNLYVADNGAGIVYKIPAGTTTTVTDLNTLTKVLTGLTNPTSLAVDASGNIFVTSNGTQIIELSNSGVQSTLATGFSALFGVAVDGAGNVYASDNGGNTIYKIKPSGGYFISPGLPGGLNFNSSNGSISGTPSVITAARDYTVTAYNALSGTTATVNIAITSPVITVGSVSGAITACSGAASVSPDIQQFTVSGSDLLAEITVAAPADFEVSLAASSGYSDHVTLAQTSGSVSSTPVYVRSAATATASGISGNVTLTSGTATQLVAVSGTINPIPAIAAITPGGPTTFCAGGSVTLTSAAASGNQWLLDGSPIDGATAQDYIATASGDYTVIVTASSCSSAASLAATVTVNDLPVITLGSTSPVSTSASSFGLSYSGLSGGTFTYSISTGSRAMPGFVAVNGSSLGASPVSVTIPTGSAVGDYDFNVTISNTTTGCTSAVIPGTLTITPSIDATLSNIALSNGTLSPVFLSGTTSYTASVPYTVTTTTVTPATTDANATVQVRVNSGIYTTVASGSASGDLALNIGDNPVDVQVTAQDGSTVATYTITVNRTTPSNNAVLTKISPSPLIHLSLVTGPDYKDYTSRVGNSVNSITLTPVTQDASCTIKVNDIVVARNTASGAIALNIGDNIINTVVTAEDGVTVTTYSIKVTRLDVVALTTYFITPAISLGTVAGPDYKNYIATTGNSVSSLTITPGTPDVTNTIVVNGLPVTSGTASAVIPLAVGENTIITTVTDGTTTKTYSLKITRQVPILTSIALSAGVTLKKVSGPDYKDYTTAVVNAVSSVTVTPITADAGSTITVNGVPVSSGTASGSIALNEGDNTITTVVTAQDGLSASTYSIKVTRQAPGLLARLLLNPGIHLSQVTGPDYRNYTARVGGSTSSVTITALSLDPANTIKVNDVTVASGVESGAIALNVGDNTITTIVTNGVVSNTYRIKVTRLAPAVLTTLALSPAIPLKTATGPDYKDYTAAADNSVNSVTLTPNTPDATNSITVNGVTVASGTASGDIALNVGDNTITTVVTDGTITNTYSIKVTRATNGGAFALAERSVIAAPSAVTVHQNLSPNGDGNGDVLLIEGIAAYPENTLQIMNRSGVLVYNVKGYDNTTTVFDGHSASGKLQQAGTYFYSLDYKDGKETKHKTGYIVLKY